MLKKKISYFFGLLAEYYVAFILLFKGYRLIKHRYKTKLGEIDLIMTRGKDLIAIEVKARRNDNCQIGEVVSIKQLYRINNALRVFLGRYGNRYTNFTIRTDIVLVHKNLFIKHLKNVWMDR